jgi:hypothetical protein
MSKDAFFGTSLDSIYRSKQARVPGWAVLIWNPNRTTIGQVVLDEAQSPAYDISQYVMAINYVENVAFESGDDPQSTRVAFQVKYDINAQPIKITEATLVDGTPLRIYQGDRRIPFVDWIPLFTGVIRGNPEVREEGRQPGQEVQTMQIVAVSREESYQNTKVTGFSYEQNEDIGQAVVETATFFMGLDAREVLVGFQDYPIGHPNSQLVDIEIMKGLHQILFTVGKKPKFNNDGFLVAADTDLAKPPARVHTDKDLVVEITRIQNLTAINNSVRLLGLSNQITEVVEPEQRLASGRLVSGFWESSVKKKIDFSEKKTSSGGGRRAKNTRMEGKPTSLGDRFDEEASWNPTIEEDGITVFGGEVIFDTGYTPDIRTGLLITWGVLAIGDVIAGYTTTQTGLSAAAAASTFDAAAPGLATASTGQGVGGLAEFAQAAVLVGLLLTFTELGNLDFEIFGEPFQYVYQQLASTAQVNGLLSADVREIQFRNDWLYDLSTMIARTKELLTREIVKGWQYNIRLMDDPLLEVDDIIQIVDRKYYITRIQKQFSRSDRPDGTMLLSAWRIE